MITLPAEFLPHFTASEQSTTHSYTILPPLAALLLNHFTPLRKLPLTLTPFCPLCQLNSYIILPPLNKLPSHSYIILPPLEAQLLPQYTPEQIPPHSYIILQPLAAHLVPGFTALKKYALTLTQFYHPLQPTSYLIFYPLRKSTPYSYTILRPLAAQLLHLFYPSEQITPPPPPPHPTHTSLYSPWQPNSYFIFPSLNKLLARSYTILSPLAAQFLHHFNTNPHPLNKLPPLLRQLSPCQLNCFLTLPPLNNLQPHSNTL